MDISVKEKILCEANKVIAEKGLNCFTLEEVARRAGVSKGGLLYHFRSKDELIRGLIDYHIEQCEKRILENKAENSSEWLESYIHSQICQSASDLNTMAGLLAAVSMNQELLKPVREKRSEWFEKVSCLNDPVMAMIIGFACDGIAFSKLFGLETFSDDVRLKIQERLISLTKECLKEKITKEEETCSLTKRV